MTGRGGDREVLEQVVLEAREEDIGVVDWDRVEQGLLARIDSDVAAETQPARSWRWVAALAAAAMIALGVGALVSRGSGQVARAPDGPARVAARVHTAATIDGGELALGDEVHATGGPSVVEHRGLAKWTLTAGSRAVVRETGETVTLRLESGSVDAEVVPSAQPETFAVEAGLARVAVHGTAFRVELRSGKLQVAVREGVVGVGPIADRGKAPKWRLDPGDSGEFELTGQTGNVNRALDAKSDSEARREDPVRAGSPLRAEPPAADVNRALDELSRAASACFTQHTSNESGVRVRVETVLRARVSPNGSVGAVTFDPPLAPAVSGCIKNSAQRLRVAPSTRGISAQRALLLGS